MKIVDKIKNKIAYEYTFFKNEKKYMNFQWQSKEYIEAIKINKLKRVLKIAVETVPFYKNLNLSIDFENFTLNELKKFPIVDKNLIRENFQSFCSTKYDGKLSHTSGSTGNPFEFKVSNDSEIFEELTSNRAWGMGKEYIYKKNDPIIVLRSYSPKENEPLYKISKSKNYWYLSPFHINEQNLDLYLNIIKQSKAKLIRGYSSSIYIFTLLLKSRNIKIPQIKTIVTSSEMLLPMYRETIEDYWQIPVLDWYGQNERTVTVQQCWAGNYHNNDDYGIIELNKENNIIATSLNNITMPFIRYNTKDKALPLDKPSETCLCGRHLSIPFKGIEGRSDDILIKDDGTMIPTANFSTAMKNFDKLLQFQIIQNKDKSVLLNIVSLDTSIEYIKLIESEVYQRLGNIKLTVKIVDEIKRDEITGKIKVTIQKGNI